ncbi:HXXEE domain-containing protein [Chitinasiproducens palmae]|uniref:HXXEE domain-containing protein n=1 Tax=Chitinasiproducens palmae TaxID=1770053 RepID=A0A1H2PTX1_9BURK|nr:HXXEE domain-containing protein [Chitinasiproducens palmae]SDV50595.1 Protein of unknown function with HXXEE motif-containing protein [Chitinasiproducens palmae]
MERLTQNWVYGGFLAGILLLAIAPVVVAGWPPSLAMGYLFLPIYMIHQYEEHDRDRFRLFLNEKIGGGAEVMSRLAVFIVNVPGVWGVLAVSLTLAVCIDTGYGLIAVYLVLVNALVHILQGVRMRMYNPGLVTALVLFLPAGLYGLRAIQADGGGRGSMHALGLAIAVAIHVAIALHVKARLRRPS